MQKFYKEVKIAIIGIFLGVNAFAQCTAPINQAITPSGTSVACSGYAAFNVASTETGVNYYLRNNLDNSIVAGPVAGTGSAINLSAGAVTTTSTYNVYAATATSGLDFETDFDNHVNVGTAMNAVFTGNNQITVEAWIKLESYSFIPTIIGNYDSGMQFLLRIDDNLPAFWVSDGISYQRAHGATVIPLDTWVHIAGTWNGTTMKVYFNGVLDGMATKGGVFPSVSNPVRIGASLLNESFDGVIDNLRVWNTVKTAAEINANKLMCYTGAQPNLVASYNFEDAAGTILSDLSGNNYHGTLVSSPVWTSGIDVCSSCNVQMATTPTVTVNAIAQQTVTPVNATVICSGEATINVASTENGLSYYLRNDADNSIVDGPVAGTGSAINLSTGTVSSTTAYNVYGAKSTTALNFNGSNNFGVIPTSSNINSHFAANTITLEGWYYINSQYYNDAMLIGESYLGDNNVAFSMVLSGTTLRGGFYNAGWFNTSATVPFNQWVHIACTYDQSNVKLYFNGLEVASTPHTAPLPSFNEEWRIGRRYDYEPSSQYLFNGKMDQVRVWNVARTQTEIQSGMNACMSGSESNLIVDLKFDELGSTAIDAAGGDQNAMLYNFDPSTQYVADMQICPATCAVEMTTMPVITVSPIANQTATPADAILCDNGSTTIGLASSQPTVNYYLRNDLNDTIIAGPLAGTGSGVSFNTGNISATTTYNVLAERTASSFALDFDGSDDYVEVPPVINIANQSFTIEFWAKRDGTGNGDFIIGQQSSTTSNNALHIGFRDNNDFTFAFYGNDLEVTNSANTDGNFHHWSCVYNAGATGTDRYVYIDGVLAASDDATGDYTGSGLLKIGVNTFGSDYFDGSIQGVKIWNIALTQAAIQNGMSNCLTGSETGLIAYYNMNDSFGTTLMDATVNAYDGVLTNMDASSVWVSGTPMVQCVSCQLELTPTVTVTVKSSSTSTITATDCDTYTAPDNAVHTTSGIKTAVISNIAGCDSTITINLTITNSTASSITAAECDTYTAPDNAVYTTSGIKTAVLTNLAGCDSTITINLTITNSSTSTITVAECDTYTAPDNAVYTTSGTKTAVISNLAGCDSTITINLTINTVDASITQSGNLLTAVTSGATYKWMNCSTNTIIAGEISQNYTATANGTYAAIVTENNCTDTSACAAVTTTDVSANATLDSQLSVYPNPNNGSFVIKSVEEGTYSIVNNLGQLIQTVTLTATDNTVEINNIENGIYFIVGFNNNHITRKKIVVTK